MQGSFVPSEKRFIWDDVNHSLILLGASKQEIQQARNRYSKHSRNSKKSEIYCPHGYLELKFADTLDPGDKIKFRRHFQRKVKQSEPNVITLQDIKDVVMFMLINPISVEFIKFFHTPVVDRFLRALIIYCQYYIEIWEDLCQKRLATAKKAPNPLVSGGRQKQSDEMQNLRALVGREYCNILIGAEDTLPYHHMVANGQSTTNEPSGQSQGEKDLRIYETLIRMTHKIVWIALQRKHSSLIEIEIHRLFRTESFNTAKRSCKNFIRELYMPEDEIRVLQGTPIPAKRKLLSNSHLPYEILNGICDHRVLSIGIADFETHDPRILYLENALLADEHKLRALGIKVGILGHQRADYDVMLLRKTKDEELNEQNGEDLEKEKWEKRDSEHVRKKIELHNKPEIRTMPSLGDDPELVAEYPVEPGSVICCGNQAAREDACKKWVARAMQHSNNNYADLISIETNN